MEVSRRDLIAVGSVVASSVLAGCGGESTEFEQEALNHYADGYAVYEKAEDTWSTAYDSFRNEEWSRAAQEMQQAETQYWTAKDHFQDALNTAQIPSKAKDVADTAFRQALVMSAAAEGHADAAAAYGAGDTGEGDEHQERGREEYEEAESINEPREVDEFRRDLGLSE